MSVLRRGEIKTLLLVSSYRTPAAHQYFWQMDIIPLLDALSSDAEAIVYLVEARG